MLALVEQYLETVEYERWANDHWITFVSEANEKHRGAQFAVESQRWLKHICGCYRGWLNTIQESNFQPQEDLESDLTIQYERLIKVVTQEDLDRVINMDGSAGTVQLTVRHIVYHMLNHATYHRGQLRAMAEAAGLTDWPETDFIKFARRSPQTVSL